MLSIVLMSLGTATAGGVLTFEAGPATLEVVDSDKTSTTYEAVIDSVVFDGEVPYDVTRYETCVVTEDAVECELTLAADGSKTELVYWIDDKGFGLACEDKSFEPDLAITAIHGINVPDTVTLDDNAMCEWAVREHAQALRNHQAAWGAWAACRNAALSLPGSGLFATVPDELSVPGCTDLEGQVNSTDTDLRWAIEQVKALCKE